MSKTIRINTCAAEELERLPQVGPKTAQKIVAARPIKDAKALEELLPPSAWLAIEESGMEFNFEVAGEATMTGEVRQQWAKSFGAVLEIGPSSLTDEEVAQLKAKWEELWPKEISFKDVPIISPEPQIQLFEPETMTLRRVPANGRLREGARYFCIWNVHWGPSGEAMFPADKPVQAEIEAWFNAHSMGIVFAHYGRSLQIGTRSRNYVPLLLFEIMEETEEAKDAGENDGTGQGN